MNKVILTQEQVEAIEIAIRDYGKDDVLNDHLSAYPDYQNWGNNLEPLNGLEPHILARALYQPDGYEVKREFKVRDWVVHEIGHPIRQVTGFSNNHLEVSDGEDGYIWSKPFVRHATPEEIKEEKRRRWWNDRNREVWGLKVGDVLKHKSDGECFSITKDDIEVFKRHPQDKLDQFYKVVCFAENRLDVKDDE